MLEQRRPTEEKVKQTPEIQKAIQDAARQPYFTSGEEVYRSGFRTELPIARTNNLEAIPEAALKEIKESGAARPPSNSAYWQEVSGATPSFLCVHTISNDWSSDAFVLKTDHSVVVVCHRLDIP
jgi:hypothetical protein